MEEVKWVSGERGGKGETWERGEGDRGKRGERGERKDGVEVGEEDGGGGEMYVQTSQLNLYYYNQRRVCAVYVCHKFSKPLHDVTILNSIISQEKELYSLHVQINARVMEDTIIVRKGNYIHCIDLHVIQYATNCK